MEFKLLFLFYFIFLFKYFACETKLKWFAYCHFLRGLDNIEMLSCGKCLIHNELKLNHPRIISNSQINSKYCSYYLKQLNKHQHLVNNDEEEISLIPNLSLTWFQDLLYLIEKKEISTNLDVSFISVYHLKIIELINFGIESVSLNAFKQFKNLRILNLSYNSINAIELSLFNLNTNLIELDLSFNKISYLKQEFISNLASLRLLNFSSNWFAQFNFEYISKTSSKLQILDLSFNNLEKLENFKSLNELIYLNLNNNKFKSVDDLFQMQTCISNKNNDVQTLDIFINNNNNWLCECHTFELIEKLNNSKETNQTCISNNLLRNYKFYFNNELNCDLNISWLYWYELNCKINNNNNSNDKLTSSLITTKTILSTQQLYFIWHSTTNNRQQQQNLTTRIIKYDMSTAFYWISSFCIVIITLSCLFIVWFYCIKKFRFSRQLGLISMNNNNSNNRRQRTSNNINRHLNRQDVSRYSPRRNIVLVNPRVNNHTTNPNTMLVRNQSNNNTNNNNNNNASSYPMTIYSNLRQQNNPQSDLYFISLPANRNGLSHLRNNHHDNLAYINDDDEPPSYYDIIVNNNNNNNHRFSIDKESSSLEIIPNNNGHALIANSTNIANTELVLDQNIQIDESPPILAGILINRLDSDHFIDNNSTD